MSETSSELAPVDGPLPSAGDVAHAARWASAHGRPDCGDDLTALADALAEQERLAGHAAWLPDGSVA